MGVACGASVRHACLTDGASQEYDFPVDLWSVGCIFAELLSMQEENVADVKDRVPLFPGKSCFPLSADSPQVRCWPVWLVWC